MRIHVVLFALTLLACGGAQRGPATTDPASQVRDAVDASNEAVRRGQTQVVLDMLDPSFVLVADGATFQRDNSVARLPTDRRIIRMDHVTNTQAVVISKSGSQRYAEVWVNHDGWKLRRLEAVSGT